MLKDTLVIMMFFFTVVSIAGQQMFKGKFKQRCFTISTVDYINNREFA
jgi:hypothetical protein